MTKFDEAFKKLIFQVYNQGFEEFNERTGLKTKILTGVHFDFQPTFFPLLTLRKIPVRVFVAEQIWFLQGEKELDFFQKYSKIWDDFKEEDNTVESAYGFRWRKFFERDQIEGLVNMFEKEPSSRQGVVVTWDANSDGLDSPKKKNVPCVPMWTANIVNSRLNFHVVFRSNDLLLGFPHDVAGFALLQRILAQRLKVKVGWLHYSISHAHIYENHYKQVEELLARTNTHPEIRLDLPENTYERALQKDETIVPEIIDLLEAQYNPLSALKMKIAV